MHHNRGRRLFRFQQESSRQLYADILLGVQQGKQLGLIFEVGTRRIAERITRSLIFLVEEIADMRRVLARDAQFLAHLFMQIFCQRLRCLYAEPVQIKIARVFTALEQTLRFF